jgi:hypothetical protein
VKKYFVLILALSLVITIGLVGCEKKQAPQPAAQPTMTQPAPAPAPVAAPVAAPAPSKPAKK